MGRRYREFMVAAALAAGTVSGGPNANARLRVDLDHTTPTVDTLATSGLAGSVWVAVRISDAVYLDTYGFYLAYDTARLSFTRAYAGTIGYGNFLESRNGAALFIGKISREDFGQVTVGNSLAQPDSSRAPSGSGLLALIQFGVRGVEGEARFSLSRARLLDWRQQEDSALSVQGARLLVQAPTPVLGWKRHWEQSQDRLQIVRRSLTTCPARAGGHLLGRRLDHPRPPLR